MSTMQFSEYEQLRFERRDNGVLLITMDRPEKYNATDEQMHGELARVWADVAADPDTRVAVITGAGKAFSAGGDIEMERRGDAHLPQGGPTLQDAPGLLVNILNCGKPHISPLNRGAVGAGGCPSALARPRP